MAGTEIAQPGRSPGSSLPTTKQPAPSLCIRKVRWLAICRCCGRERAIRPASTRVKSRSRFLEDRTAGAVAYSRSARNRRSIRRVWAWNRLCGSSFARPHASARTFFTAFCHVAQKRVDVFQDLDGCTLCRSANFNGQGSTCVHIDDRRFHPNIGQVAPVERSYYHRPTDTGRLRRFRSIQLESDWWSHRIPCRSRCWRSMHRYWEFDPCNVSIHSVDVVFGSLFVEGQGILSFRAAIGRVSLLSVHNQRLLVALSG